MPRAKRLEALGSLGLDMLHSPTGGQQARGRACAQAVSSNQPETFRNKNTFIFQAQERSEWRATTQHYKHKQAMARRAAHERSLDSFMDRFNEHRMVPAAIAIEHHHHQ